MKTVNLITKDNGVGLSKDIQIVNTLLSRYGYTCKFIDVYSHNYTKADINIFLELVNSRYLPVAPINILIPNPEWFNAPWTKYINYMACIVCKTIDTARIFQKYGRPCIYTSFSGIDMIDDGVVRKHEFLHLAGKSSHKNTAAVLRCWEKNNRLPLMHLIKSERFTPQSKGNIAYHLGGIALEEVKQLVNACMFHLCPSEYEGFGHYISEAKSVGGIIVSTDAPPMNEMVNSTFGRLVKPAEHYMHNLGRCYKVNADELYSTVDELLQLSEKELSLMQECSRQEFLDNKLFFEHEFLGMIKQF